MNIEHLAFNVSDPVAMADWYVRHLGMQVARKVEGPTHTHFLADGAGRTVLELYRHQAPVPDYAKMDPFVLHIAFHAADVKKEQDRLLAAGATLAADHVVTPAGDEMAFLRDPWGLTIQLIKRKQPLL
jgi:catechol 2,3-dioxygenase-like lactoylglutathione lyase family enzyme